MIEFYLSPEQAFNEEALFKACEKKARGKHFRLVKRSLDARKAQIKVLCRIELAEKEIQRVDWTADFPKLDREKRVVIIGCGPAGMFAALTCLEQGLKPIILDRGKDVRSRRRDLAKLNREHLVNPDSNYCFGEGGAGTYSDGKLYTRSTKRGDVKRILEILHVHGAREEILYDAHPHIGTNKLPNVVTAIRETILQAGGEIHFESRVDDFLLDGEEMKAVKLQDGAIIQGNAFILATGHSARDIYELLHTRNIYIEPKPFALGVRIEHPQHIIDRVQYHSKEGRGEWLPPASYSLKHQVNDNRGVFSFCMCPGGFIVPSATQPGELVVNGMSPSKRNSPFANSGTVVTVDQRDFKAYERFGVLSGMHFQAEVERKASESTGGGQTAPAQKLPDFVNGKISSQLNDTSYVPGLQSKDFVDILPPVVYRALHEGVRAFGKKMKGYYTAEAQLIGIESRTSAPIKIPRDRESLHHPQIKNLYPCGEGAGYAGGIVSAAIDGTKVAQQVKI